MEFNIKRIQLLLEKRIKDKFIEEYLEGLASGKTIEDIFNMYPDVSQDSLKKEYEAGIKVEYEHTKDKEIATRIALDHMMESPTYYEDLARHVEKNKHSEVVTEDKTIDEEEYDGEETDLDDEGELEKLERDYDNSDNIQEILNHENLVELASYMQLSKQFKKAFASRNDSNADGTSKECFYFLAELEEDVRLDNKKLVLRKGFYSLEKFVNTVPKIKVRVYTGGYDTPEDCLDNTVNKLLDLENTNAGTEVSLINMGLDYDFGS